MACFSGATIADVEPRRGWAWGRRTDHPSPHRKQRGWYEGREQTLTLGNPTFRVWLEVEDLQNDCGVTTYCE